MRAHFPGAAAPSPRRARGFALLIVVTLLAFLVVLLIGLAAYTRIETAVAGNTQRQAQARENALLALNIALGQLQKYAGPDQRVTATAESYSQAAPPPAEGESQAQPASANTQKIRYTGVWHTDTSTTADATTPLAWLVSGIERGTPEDVTVAIPAAQRAELVGVRTAGAANSVVAPLQEIRAAGLPGFRPGVDTPIGRYAWWIGDQGVKAPVAVPDATDGIDFAPYDSAELRSRIRQQIALGAGAANANGGPVFEPRDANNTTLVRSNGIVATTQIAFLKNSANNAIGLNLVQQNFHTWSPNNYAVLANTRQGGLRQDLSINPSLLGAAFAAWTNFSAYMEPLVPDPNATSTSTAPTIQPPYGTDPLRRRYVMTPHQLDGDGSHQVGPVLTYFLLTFNVRTRDESTATVPMEVRARWMVSLWNPYTGALVPENLRIEVSRLPQSVVVVDEEIAGPPVATFSLRQAYGDPMAINLPWDSASSPSSAATEDRQSWLPGRVYTWRSEQNTDRDSGVPAEGYASQFYSRTLDDGGSGVIRSVAPGSVADGDHMAHLEVTGPEQLSITLYAVRPDGDVRLGRFTSPPFVENFITESQQLSRNGYQFSYVFRLAESIDTPTTPGTWLMTEGRDLRRRTLPSECFVAAENGNDPAQYGGSYKKISSPDRLIDRRTDSWSYNEDVPVFELPRMPLLSLGAAQHFRLVGRRPFMIGNPWGVNADLNNIGVGELFDRFFFSGLVDGIAPATTTAGDLILPNALLKPLRLPTGDKPTVDDIRSAPEARTSKALLQAGAFNLNSVNVDAWAAVLRGVRFPAPQSFSFLNATEASGTADDSARDAVQSGEAQFFRFSQSAQETFRADAGQAGPPTEPSVANTHLFRRGMRTLSESQVRALAAKIGELIRVRHGTPDAGVFRSLQEFLAPSSVFASVDAQGVAGAPRSLLEAAIADAGTNADIAEFSSQWLTQADIMTALAPVLFARSDTFVIRTYGEVLNPTTSTAAAPVVEGRAWCEAIVQRLPEFFDPTDPPETAASVFDTPSNPDDSASPPTQGHQLNKALGRRFKVVSFRWLTRSDI